MKIELGSENQDVPKLKIIRDDDWVWDFDMEKSSIPTIPLLKDKGSAVCIS